MATSGEGWGGGIVREFGINMYTLLYFKWITNKDFPGGSTGKESASSAGDLGSIPGLGRSPGGGHGTPLQYSRLENPMDSKHSTKRINRESFLKYRTFCYTLL